MIQLNIINFLDVQQIGLLAETLPTIVLRFENFTYLPLAKDKKIDAVTIMKSLRHNLMYYHKRLQTTYSSQFQKGPVLL